MTPFQFVAAVLASYRGTRIVTTDSIFEGTRRRVVIWGLNRNDVLGDKAATLVECPWCVGVWVSLLVTCVILRRLPWRLGKAGFVTVAAVAGGQATMVATEAWLSKRAKLDEARATIPDSLVDRWANDPGFRAEILGGVHPRR